MARTSGEDSMFDARLLYGDIIRSHRAKNSKALPPADAKQRVQDLGKEWAADEVNMTRLRFGIFLRTNSSLPMPETIRQRSVHQVISAGEADLKNPKP